MLAHIDSLLARYGRWAIRADSGALGYAKMSILAGASEGEEFAEPSPPPDVTMEDFRAVEKAILNLPIVHISCVAVVYILLPNKSLVKQAAKLGISRQALTQYIDYAQRNIARQISLRKI
jgi:hypothetical protein